MTINTSSAHRMWLPAVAFTSKTLTSAQLFKHAPAAWKRLEWILEELVPLFAEIQSLPHSQRKIRAWTRRYWRILSCGVKLVPEPDFWALLNTQVALSHDTCTTLWFHLGFESDAEGPPIELEAAWSRFRARLCSASPGATIGQGLVARDFWHVTAAAALYDALERNHVPANVHVLLEAANVWARRQFWVG